jgi:hypothetical protein
MVPAQLREGISGLMPAACRRGARAVPAGRRADHCRFGRACRRGGLSHLSRITVSVLRSAAARSGCARPRGKISLTAPRGLASLADAAGRPAKSVRTGLGLFQHPDGDRSSDRVAGRCLAGIRGAGKGREGSDATAVTILNGFEDGLQDALLGAAEDAEGAKGSHGSFQLRGRPDTCPRRSPAGVSRNAAAGFNSRVRFGHLRPRSSRLSARSEPSEARQLSVGH